MVRSPTPSGVHPQTQSTSPHHPWDVIGRIPVVLGALAILAGITAACNSGSTGPVGPEGPAGTPAQTTSTPAFNAATCTTPCHGFDDSIVTQWEQSAHFAGQSLALSTPTVIDYGEPCGGCHALDGLQLRLAGQVSTVGDAGVSELALGHINYMPPDAGVSQAGYAGYATSSQIHCVVCHDFTPDNDPHLTGYFQQVPLRVPFGDERMYVEASPSRDGGITGSPTVASYGSGNECVWCHKSTTDVTFAISPTRPTAITPYWGPHRARNPTSTPASVPLPSPDGPTTTVSTRTFRTDA